MTDITPELIAQIATRLLNTTPQATPQSTSQAMTAPVSTASHPFVSVSDPGMSLTDAVSAGQTISNPIPMPLSAARATEGFPLLGQGVPLPQRPPLGFHHFGENVAVNPESNSFPVGHSGINHAAVDPFAAGHHAVGHHAVGQTGVNLSGFDHSGSMNRYPADISIEGLRNFVAQIRNPTAETEQGFCPGPPGIGQLRQALAARQTPANIRAGGSRPLDIPSIRRDFPALNQRVHGKPLVWFDNAATTHKPQSVIDAISHYYAHDNSNIHRAAHTLAARSTDAFEAVREKVQRFLGAATKEEILFVRGTTEGVNLVSQTYGRKFLQSGDEILLSMLEHHANIVPWQMVAQEKGAHIRVIPVNDRGEVLLEEYQRLLGPRTKLVALTQASNSLGTILPVAEMTQMAKRYGARVLIDGAQSVSHLPVNVQDIGCDFFVFSGHKIFGPNGIGVVYVRSELQEIMPPWQGGGNMIKSVTFEETTYADPPNKFEAGTPNIADTVGLGAALDYVQQLGLPNIGRYEHELLEYATERLLPIKGLRLIGQARDKVSVISFVLKDRRTEEIGKRLDLEGIAVRAGHHCAQPSLRRYGVESTVRPSFAFYNTKSEIDHLVSVVQSFQSR
jgi:cysteine desulfurase/selenocysteine lyase